MSTINDYIASSNNSINDNKYNAKKARSTIHQLKQLLRPLLALVKKTSRKNTYKKSPQPSFYIEENNENDQNAANELLEQRIFEEIDSCDEYSAVPVYNSNGMDIVPVVRGQHYIPVHFARTEAGTFFWTSFSSADSDICYASDKYAVSENQVPECQVPCDRWAQA